MTNYHTNSTNNVDFSVIKHYNIKTYRKAKANLPEFLFWDLHGGTGLLQASLSLLQKT
jgi:hypothetical protein